MTYKKAIIISGILFASVMTGLSQNRAILKGRVQPEAGEAIDFYTLALLSPVDSSIMALEMFFDTEFQFEGIRPQAYILRLRDVQYMQYDTLITVVDGTNVLPAPVVLKPVELGEVTVRASRPAVSHSNGNFTLHVGNSYLKDEIRIGDLLGKLPGVVVDNGAILMFGKDNLLIYINGSEVRAQEQIRSLQPTDIDRIEVIRNVGAEYSADVDAVLKIWTKKDRAEKAFLSITDNLEIKRYAENSVNLSLHVNYNEKVAQYFTFSNDAWKSRQFDRSWVHTWFDDYRNLSAREVFIHNKFGSNNLFYSLNYSTGRGGELGVQYSGNFSGGNDRQQGKQFIYHGETPDETVDFDNHDARDRNFHNVSLNWKQQIKNGELSVIADYVIDDSGNTNDISESSMNDGRVNKLLNISDGDFRVFSASPEYRLAKGKTNWGWGAKYSSVSGNTSIEYRPSMKTERHKTDEQTTGAFMTFDIKLPFADINAGIRTEYTSTAIRSDNGQYDLKRDYFNLFPSITVSRKINEHLDVATYYRRRIQRPSFSSLNPAFTYRDSLTYVTGNPRLKPAIIDNLNFSVNFRKFNFSTTYNIYRDYIMFEDIPDTSNPDITISTYGNLKDRYRLLNLSLSHAFNHPAFNSMTSLSLRKPWLKMLFNGEQMSFNRPRSYFQTSGNVNILKNTSLGYSFSYSSAGDAGNLRYKAFSNLTASVTQYLMNRQMMISLAVKDIFEQKRSNRFTSYSSHITYEMDTDPIDMRALVLTVRYNWGVSKSIRKKTSDTDSINRLP
ncbi:MAG: TonB-dependent receptor [Tannerella sp.]|jgi:hypothetical protein|nr:TonB-dependent receptor [Tannerella sp.]